jgi:hypothetical protein
VRRVRIDAIFPTKTTKGVLSDPIARGKIAVIRTIERKYIIDSTTMKPFRFNLFRFQSQHEQKTFPITAKTNSPKYNRSKIEILDS